MYPAPGLHRHVAVALLTLALGVGCGRWQPAKSYDVATQADPASSFATVLRVAADSEYQVVSKDEAQKKVRLESHTNSSSFIDVDVSAGAVHLAAAGKLVRDGKVHKNLARELGALREKFEQQLAGGGAAAVGNVAAPSTSPAPPAPATGTAATATGVPVAWSEPAYDPSVWGNGNFTCLPVKVPLEHQAALTLQLTTGEKAELQLSLAYAPELCRSPSQCKVPSGCPALGIGDPERVSRLAARLAKGQIGAQAILLDGGNAVANVDLSKHGSIVQAMSELSRQ
jgi:hypothetical protein